MSEQVSQINTGRGTWFKYTANYPLRPRETDKWYVELQEPFRKTTWGPFETEEEAIQVSGFPKPKTEVEELWEVIDHAKPHLLAYGRDMNSQEYQRQVRELQMRIRNLEAKWKK